MTTRIQRRIRALAGCVLLLLGAAAFSRAAEIALPVTRFLAFEGTPLADDWQAAGDTPVFVLIHGFQAQGTHPPFLRQAAAVQHRFPQADVVIVDWHVPQPVAATGQVQANWWDKLRRLAVDYDAAVAATRYVARDIADWMHHRQIDPARTVLSGHSLGAHIAGFAAREATARMGRRVHAILAADPAGPAFAGQASDARLDSSDAWHVIVIHTTDSLGYAEALGTWDIYVHWPEPHTPLPIAAHSHARELVTESFLRPEMVCDQGHPFGTNVLTQPHVDNEARSTRTTYLDVPAGTAESEDVRLRLATSGVEGP